MSQEFRRAPRREVPEHIAVIDTMTERSVGRLGNVSETGMLLIAHAALIEDALYQFRFTLGGANEAAATIEVGAHLLWQDGASASGQHWSGFRFIALLEEQRRQLRDWLHAPGARLE